MANAVQTEPGPPAAEEPSAAEPAPAEPTPAEPAAPRRRWHRWLALLLVLLGVSTLIYPVVATRYNNARQQQFAEEYTGDTASLEPGRAQAALEQARAYNTTLDGRPILDPWLTSVQGGSTEYRRYLGTLSEFDAMARLRVPGIGVDLPVRHGTEDEVLATGVGHLYGTALPVGGAGSHSVLTSHTGLADATLFDRLTEVRVGDEVYVDVYGETLAYQVDQIRIVAPEQTEDLAPVAGQDLITLITCTPYAVNTHRLLVRAHRVPFAGTSADVPDAAGQPLEPWMYGLLATAAGCLVVTSIVVIVSRRRRRQDETASIS